MVLFNDWCSASDSAVGSHTLSVLSGDPARLDVGLTATAAIVPTHYAAEEQISRVLTRLGKPGAAKLVSEKLPTTKSIRSGDLGEILATEYIAGHTAYAVPIKRLRWKDHRNMAMRGDDVIGIDLGSIEAFAVGVGTGIEWVLQYRDDIAVADWRPVEGRHPLAV